MKIFEFCGKEDRLNSKYFSLMVSKIITNDLKINNQITNIPNLNNRTLNIHNKSDDLVKIKILDALIKEINKEINKEKSNNFMITMTKQ